MSIPVGKRVLAVSMALAAAGVLACVAALYNIWVPKGSLVAFVVSLPLLALAVIAVMVGFVKACEKCEDWLHGRRNRLFGVGGDDEEPLNVRVDPRQRTPRDPWPASQEPSGRASQQDAGRRLLGLPGPSSPKSPNGAAPKSRAAGAVPKNSIWRGQ